MTHCKRCANKIYEQTNSALGYCSDSCRKHHEIDDMNDRIEAKAMTHTKEKPTAEEIMAKIREYGTMMRYMNRTQADIEEKPLISEIRTIIEMLVNNQK